MSKNDAYRIRDARTEDLAVITDIYNAVILEGGLTADLALFSIESKQGWFRELQKSQDIFVVEKDSVVTGYFYFSPWRSGREALKHVAEISFYISSHYRRQGLGSMIMNRAITLAENKRLHHLLAILLDSNEASVGLLKKFGFDIAGHLPDIAQIRGRSYGQYLMLKKI